MRITIIIDFICFHTLYPCFQNATYTAPMNQHCNMPMNFSRSKHQILQEIFLHFFSCYMWTQRWKGMTKVTGTLWNKCTKYYLHGHMHMQKRLTQNVSYNIIKTNVYKPELNVQRLLTHIWRYIYFTNLRVLIFLFLSLL